MAGRGLLGGFVLGTALLGCVLLGLTLWNTVQLVRLANRPAPGLVQLADGQAIRVGARPSYAREYPLIRRFVGIALEGLFTWRLFIPASEPGQKEIVDPGVALSNREKLPTSVFQMGFCLSEDLRSELLRQLARLSAKTLESRSAQVIFTASFIGEPEPVADRSGVWKVTVVGQQVVYSKQRVEGLSLPFNKEIYLRAVEPPIETGLPKTPIEQAIYRMRSSGLEIYAIRSLTNDPSPLD